MRDYKEHLKKVDLFLEDYDNFNHTLNHIIYETFEYHISVLRFLRDYPYDHKVTILFFNNLCREIEDYKKNLR